MSKQVKPWYHTFRTAWRKAAGAKPDVDHCEQAGAVLAAAGYQLGKRSFAAAMALREGGVTMSEYQAATGATGPCLNLIGNHKRNAAKRKGLVKVTAFKRDGATAYQWALTAKGRKVAGVDDAAQPDA